MFKRLLTTGNSASGFFLRISLGIVMLFHGLQQTLGLLGGIGLHAKLNYYHSLGVPKFIGFCGIMVVSIGAILLIIGCWGRIMAFLTLAFLVTALFMGGHLHNGIFMNWESQRPGEGFEYHILGIGICIALIIYGSGWLSIDRWLTRKNNKTDKKVFTS